MDTIKRDNFTLEKGLHDKADRKRDKFMLGHFGLFRSVYMILFPKHLSLCLLSTLGKGNLPGEWHIPVIPAFC